MKDEMHKDADGRLFEYAKRLRKENTKSERILWNSLRDRKFMNLKFRRQHPLRNYILDFYCHDKKLCIELDGGIHNDKAQAQYDIARTEVLNELGITVLRFKNEQVIGQLKSVLTMMADYLIPGPSE